MLKGFLALSRPRPVPSSQSAVPSSESFNRQLAGLRGVAVMMVVLLHTGVPGFLGGYLGVDLFFVLSGYLISKTLLRAIDRSGAVLARFYWHRFLRLAPALVAVSLAVALLGGGDDRHVRDALAGLTYVANWTRAFATADPVYLGHCWSLAIEEQFYLLWPALLLGLLAVGNRRRAAVIALVLAIVVMVWRFYAAGHGYSAVRIYNGFDFRADGLLLGCALSLATFGDTATALRLGRIARVTVLPAAIVFGAVFLIYSYADPFMLSIGYSIVSLCCVALVAYFVLPGIQAGYLHALLGTGTLVWLGEVSYGIYLYHYPLVLYLERTLGSILWVTIIGVSGTLLIAAASYRLIEIPARRLRSWSPGRIKWAGSATAAYFLAAIAAGMWFFFRGDINEAILPDYKVRIVGYGPTTIQSGMPFNLQPDGSSALWLKTDAPVPTAARVRLGETMLQTSISGSTITASVPRGMPTESDSIDLTLIGWNKKAISDPVTIRIEAP